MVQGEAEELVPVHICNTQGHLPLTFLSSSPVPNCLDTPNSSKGHYFIQCGTVDISKSLSKLKWQGKQPAFRHIDDAGLRTVLDKMRILRQPSFSSHLSLPGSFLFLSHVERVYMWEFSKCSINWDADHSSKSSILTGGFRNILRLNINYSLVLL